jgi:hypothetical protein
MAHGLDIRFHRKMRELTFQKQTKLRENGHIGNCMMTCYANYLGLDVQECPQIEELFSSNEPKGFWASVVKLWWEEQGYDFHFSSSEEEVLKEVGDDYYFVGGETPRSSENKHLVIYRKGKMVFDPHPDGGGITKVTVLHYVKKR